MKQQKNVSHEDNRSASSHVQSLSSQSDTIQRKTRIDHSTDTFSFDDSSDKVGVGMQAYLDPHDPVVGSATGTPQKKLYQAVKQAAKASMVRGHLLNHDLGGYGVPENLYPITSSANSKHKNYVENPVQKWLNKAQLETNSTEYNKNNGTGVFYSVNVGNAQNDVEGLVTNKVTFVCKAATLKNVGKGTKGAIDTVLFNTTIESDTNGKKSVDRGRAFKTDTNNEAPDMKETKKVIPKGWKHGGRSGALDFLSKVQAKNIGVDELADKPIVSRLQHYVDGANSIISEINEAQDEFKLVREEAIEHGIEYVNEEIYELKKTFDIWRNILIHKIFEINKLLSLNARKELIYTKCETLEKVAEYALDAIYDLTLALEEFGG